MQLNITSISIKGVNWNQLELLLQKSRQYTTIKREGIEMNLP